MIKTGDTVIHRPTGETWVVAVVREDEDRLSWCGWPEGMANLSDCDLVESCSDEYRLALLKDMAAMRSHNDHRFRYATAELARLERVAS